MHTSGGGGGGFIRGVPQRPSKSKPISRKILHLPALYLRQQTVFHDPDSFCLANENSPSF